MATTSVPSSGPAARAPLDGPPGDAAARIAAAADQWKRKLLDLTKRNRALNFRPTRVSTVAVVDEHPAEVFRQLVVREATMRFKAAPERPAAAAATAAATETPSAAPAGEPTAGLEDDEAELPAQDFAPYDPAVLNERHTDDWLQTTLTPEALDRSLRRLDEQARLAIEEQGVNTLFLGLGMLHYVEATDSAQPFRAPLVLVPVQLSRRSARAGYVLRATGDDPLVNPALAELLRRGHDVQLPDLPDAAALGDDYDLQGFLAEVAARIAERAGWSVKTDVVLALFSFQKFVMFKDLETNAAALGAHRLIGRLVTRQGDDGEHLVGLPDDVRTMDLDAEHPPERTFQVVDADASQLRAIAAAARGHDLVIEGPPGTGKSQTITNLIAQALAAGQSVLFVAEKMAALSVVHARLVEAGFGEFCLELHSTKANKRAVMQALGAAMDASLQPVVAPTASTERLPVVRATLTDYVRALHAPRGALGVSPYRAYGEVGRVLDAPRVAYAGPVDGVSLAQLEQAIRDLADLAQAGAAVGVPDRHPWRDSTRTFYTGDDVDAARELARAVVAGVDATTTAAAGVQAALQLPPIATMLDVQTAAAVADVLRRSPGAPLAVLESEAWNAPPAEATRLIAQGRQVVALRDRLLAQLAPEALERDHADDAAYVERKAQGILSFLAFLDGRHRAIKKRWTAYRRAGWAPSMAEQVDVMRQVDRLRAERAALAAAEPAARALFGGLWAGEASDWEVLANYVRWVVEFRGVCVRHGLTGRAVEVATRAAPDVSAVDALLAAARQAQDALARLRAFVGWPDDYLAAAPFAAIGARAEALAGSAHEAPRWAVLEVARRAVDGGIARGMLPLAWSGELAFDAVVPAFRRAFWLAWLNAALRERPALERFATLTHEARIAEFRELDRRVLHENRAALVGRLRERVQQRLRTPEASAGLPVLRREIARQRGHAPLRRTLTQADAAVRAIKPCWMMSPLTVAQYVPGDRPTFDLVIFDEASQLPVEDAVGAVSRGGRLVVVGDPKQLPPTNFFAASLGQADVARAEDGSPIYEDSESILEEFMGAGVPMSRLRWHYRSAHESLINFSNVSFYDADLHTFPSVETASAASGLQFRHVEQGVYEGKGLNLAEARAVVDEVVRFAREQLDRRAAGEKPQSLGVGTFNLRQQLAIQDELEQRRRDDPALEAFFDRGVPEPFFVKNLENIQGDERDVIFLSVTYAKGTDGRLRYNFGPLNGENGWRRLNVLTTRARQRMVVFSSMRGEEISAAATTSRGAQLLREFLNYAEHGRLESAVATRAADTESPFERDVLQELTRRGLTVVPQVGVAGYRIDLGVLDDAAPGRFLCGIECDGASYHASETARDRDRLRQQVLEARGWTIHRVWSTDWFKDRNGQVERLLALVEDTRRRAREEREAERDARAHAAALAAERAVVVEADRREEAAAIAAVAAVPYVRPGAAPYALAPVEDRFAGHDLLAAPESQLVGVVREIVAVEAPIHEAELVSRVAGAWGSRVGSRIQARILQACRAAERTGLVRRRGAFLWGTADDVAVRSRASVRTPADRIAPEEYAAAIRLVLASGHAFSRAQLTTEVRALLGYARTGAALDEAIGAALDGLLAGGVVGEGSAGVRLRQAGAPAP
jgi:very-short-patch-repair endonuclease